MRQEMLMRGAVADGQPARSQGRGEHSPSDDNPERHPALDRSGGETAAVEEGTAKKLHSEGSGQQLAGKIPGGEGGADVEEHTAG